MGHENMPVSFNNLPLEIQRQILSHLYQPWHLETKNVPAFNRVPIYTFAASVRIDSGPILACRSMHDVAVDLLEEKFTGLLDASTTRHDEQHSIMPKYKPFLHKIFTLVLGSLGSLATMGTIYCQRLPSLDIIEIIPKEKIFLALSVDLQSILLNHILHTTSHDEAMVTSMAAFWHYCKQAATFIPCWRYCCLEWQIAVHNL